MKVKLRPHEKLAGWYTLDYRPYGTKMVNGIKGKREREHFENYELAMLRKEELEGVTPRRQEVFPRMRDVVDEYLVHCERRLSPATVYSKRCRLLKYIIPALGDRRVKELSQTLLDRYGEAMKPTVYQLDIKYIMALVTWMVKRKYAVKLDWQPEKEPQRAKVKRLPRLAEAEQVIAALPKEFHRIMCQIMLYAGLRWNEVRNLRWENYSSCLELVPVEGQKFGTWERSVTVIAKETKNHDEEIVSIPSICHEWFEAGRQAKGLIFPSERTDNRLGRLQYPLDQVAEKIGIRMTPHMFRHVSGTELYRHTKDIYRVMQHLRHKNIKDTMIYVRYAASWGRESVEMLVR